MSPVNQLRLTSPVGMLLAMVLLAAVLVMPASQSPDPALATRSGEWRTVLLEDGTVVTLGPRTVLTYAFDHERRAIHLLDGEALFKVRKDPHRPFVVHTPNGCAQALGTIFSVRHNPRSTQVTTQEGIVAVARQDRQDRMHANCSRKGIRLFAGQKAVVESWTPLVAREVDTTIEHAWTQRRIIFTGQTVEQALSEFNRRNWVQLDMPEDPEVLKIKVFGSFDLADPERFARYLESELRWRRLRQPPDQ